MFGKQLGNPRMAMMGMGNANVTAPGVNGPSAKMGGPPNAPMGGGAGGMGGLFGNGQMPAAQQIGPGFGGMGAAMPQGFQNPFGGGAANQTAFPGAAMPQAFPFAGAGLGMAMQGVGAAAPGAAPGGAMPNGRILGGALGSLYGGWNGG